MVLIPLLLAKLALYYAICRFALKLFRLTVEDASAWATKFGLIRLAIGLVSGVLIFYAFAFLQDSGLSDPLSYALSFGIARYLEWFVVLRLIAMDFNCSIASFGRKGQLWLMLGTAANVATDQLVLLAGLGNLKFVC